MGHIIRTQLKLVRANSEYQELPELIELIDGELIELESRLPNKEASSITIEAPWWKFWK